MTTSAVAKPRPAPQPNVTNPATLLELQNARFTYDYLRRKGDPVQFWEALLLARNRRALVATGDGKPITLHPESEIALLKELEAIRADGTSLVQRLRGLLEGVPDLPQPADRLEMALAFLLTSPRDRQAAGRWLEDPGYFAERAAKKLQSLATVSDPYREALLPWTVDGVSNGAAVGKTSGPRQESIARPMPPPAARKTTSTVNAKSLETLRMALRCRELLVRVNLSAEVWETLLLAITEPGAVRTTLEKTAPAAGSGRLNDVRTVLEVLFTKVGELREVYAEWVRLLHAHMVEKRCAPGDRWAFDVGLGLMLSESRTRDRLGYWIQDPAAGQDEAAALLVPCIHLAEAYLAALKE